MGETSRIDRCVAVRAHLLACLRRPVRRWPRHGGYRQRDGYRETIEAAGFEVEAWRENDAYRFVSERAANATRKYGVTSISLLARRR